MLYHQIIVVLGVLPRPRFDTCYTYFIPLIVEVNLILLKLCFEQRRRRGGSSGAAGAADDDVENKILGTPRRPCPNSERDQLAVPLDSPNETDQAQAFDTAVLADTLGNEQIVVTRQASPMAPPYMEGIAATGTSPLAPK